MSSDFFLDTCLQIVVVTLLSRNLGICCNTYACHLIYAQLTSYPNNQLVSLHISENLFWVAPSSLIVCPANFNYLSLAILIFYSQLYKIPVLCLDTFFLAQNSENGPQKAWGEIVIFVSICFSSLRYITVLSI